jgi:hypothetical protein
MSPKIRSSRAQRRRHSPAATLGTSGQTAYRYVSAGEVMVIQASQPQRVPNVDLAGIPKRVYFTWNLYKKVTTAEVALKIGVHHPAGPSPSPSDRVRIDLAGIFYFDDGIVPGGTGTQLYTNDSPFVLSITQLAP